MKRRIRIIIVFILPYILLAGVFTAVIKISTGPMFELKQVVVYGSVDIFSSTAFLRKYRNILFMDTQILEKQIRENPYVRNVSVIKQYPNTLFLNIEERQPVVRIQQNEEIYYFDEDGYKLRPLLRYADKSYPRFNCVIVSDIKEDQINRAEILYLLKLTQIIRKIGLPILEISCSGDKLSLNIDGVIVYISPKQAVADVEASLLLLFKQFRIEGQRPYAIDLRFDKPVLLSEDIKQASSSTEAAQFQNE